MTIKAALLSMPCLDRLLSWVSLPWFLILASSTTFTWRSTFAVRDVIGVKTSAKTEQMDSSGKPPTLPHRGGPQQSTGGNNPCKALCSGLLGNRVQVLLGKESTAVFWWFWIEFWKDYGARWERQIGCEAL